MGGDIPKHVVDQPLHPADGSAHPTRAAEESAVCRVVEEFLGFGAELASLNNPADAIDEVVVGRKIIRHGQPQEGAKPMGWPMEDPEEDGIAVVGGLYLESRAEPLNKREGNGAPGRVRLVGRSEARLGRSA